MEPSSEAPAPTSPKKSPASLRVMSSAYESRSRRSNLLQPLKLRARMAFQNLEQVLRKRRPCQHCVAPCLLRLMLQIHLNMRQVAQQVDPPRLLVRLQFLD